MKGAGYKPNNSGSARGVTNRAHEFTQGTHPFWAYLEAHNWKRIEAKGEWEFRRYQRGGEIAIFHLRKNGNMTTSGHSERLIRGFYNEQENP